MAFHDAQIHLRIKAGQCHGPDRVAVQFEAKFLLVHRRWRQQRGFHAAAEPFRRRPLDEAELFDGLGPARGAGRFSVAYGNDQLQRLAFQHLRGYVGLFIGAAHPAGA